MSFAPKAKDNATGRLNAGISPSTLSIALESGDGAYFPQPYSGSATSGGSSTTLNSTGIGASGVVVGDYIHNVTDNSWAVITVVATHSVTTTKLKGGTDNSWDNADVWRVNEFVATLATINAEGNDTAYEEVLVSGRSTDTVTVPTGGRGYNSTVAQAFLAGDYFQLRVTSPYYENLKTLLYNVNAQTDTNTNSIATIISNLASTSNALGASLVGAEDAGGYYATSTIEAILQEVGVSLAAAVTLSQIGWYGDGNDSAPTWTSGASLDPSTEKRYTTATLPISQTLTVSSVNTPLVIHNTGNVVINGTVDMNGKGAAGGAGRSGSDGAGSSGTAGNSLITGWTNGNGIGGGGSDGNTGAGGGASAIAAGDSGDGAGGAGGTKIDSTYLAFLANIFRGVACGGGGGGGGRSGGAGTGGAGGAGGGALVWYIGGNLTLGSSSVIRCAGSGAGSGSGTTGGGGVVGGGGGGGAGTIIIIVRGTITNSGTTLSAAGGAKGAGHRLGVSDSNNEGGNGAAGQILIYSLSTGTLITA